MTMNSDPNPLWILSLFVASVVVPLLIILFRFRRPLASQEVSPDSTWRLGILPSAGRRYRLCLRYDIRHRGSEDRFGLVADYTLMRGGELLVREKAGVGDIQPPERDRRIGSQSLCSFSSTLGDSRSRATVVLAKVGPFDGSMEITAEGQLLTDQGSWLQKATVFFV